MKDNHLAQMREELRTFRGTALYKYLRDGTRERRMSLWKKLLTLGLQSSDPAVRGVSEAITSESSFTQRIGWVEAQRPVPEKEPEPEDDGKFYHDFNQDLGVMAESDLEF